ncbi:probable apyrase 6 [Glycine soja]|uniref:Putative apyrase 6 isoform A n=1 Tax=Glycine soja TaxID=3848 RepID=A0A445LYW2_GLYSO|nr:probable apyrase 6 [Glycine soja]RZC28507.1 putative apyrase 6 isoform A [Glycine soja]
MRRSNARTRSAASNLNNNNELMDPIKTKTRSTNLFTRNPKAAQSKSLRSIILVSLALSFLFLVSYFAFSPPEANFRYRIIVDGGSTGTRVHVFKYRSGRALEFSGREGLKSMRVNPGLSAFAEDPEGAGGSVAELVEFAKRWIPRESWGETEIRLMATAGLRMLDAAAQERILASCRKVVRDSGFMFRDEWASVITGSDEGVYAWVVANYALGTLGGDPLETTGIIELGGASAQVTFVSREAVLPSFSRTVKFGNTTYNLYSHSFLHFGLNAAQDSLKEALVLGEFNLASQSLQKGLRIDPCTPTGYSYNVESWKFPPSSESEKNQYQSTVQARGNFSECRSVALTLLQKGKESCSYQHCDIGSNFIPKLQGKFLATENFFYTSKFFGLTPRAYLSKLMNAGKEFCGKDWLRLKKKYVSHDEEDLLRYCFSSAYIVALLHDSLGIALDDERVKVANQVGSIPLDWALGAFILQTAADADIKNHNWIATIFSDESHTLLSIIGIFIVLLTAWSISRWRKPQLKTIYDLEKGRYIITRVGR